MFPLTHLGELSWCQTSSPAHTPPWPWCHRWAPGGTALWCPNWEACFLTGPSTWVPGFGSASLGRGGHNGRRREIDITEWRTGWKEGWWWDEGEGIVYVPDHCRSPWTQHHIFPALFQRKLGLPTHFSSCQKTWEWKAKTYKHRVGPYTRPRHTDTLGTHTVTHFFLKTSLAWVRFDPQETKLCCPAFPTDGTRQTQKRDYTE